MTESGPVSSVVSSVSADFRGFVFVFPVGGLLLSSVRVVGASASVDNSVSRVRFKQANLGYRVPYLSPASTLHDFLAMNHPGGTHTCVPQQHQLFIQKGEKNQHHQLFVQKERGSGWLSTDTEARCGTGWHQSPAAAAEAINKHGLHVLVNLNGYTNGGRCAARPYT